MGVTITIKPINTCIHEGVTEARVCTVYVDMSRQFIYLEVWRRAGELLADGDEQLVGEPRAGLGRAVVRQASEKLKRKPCLNLMAGLG